MFNSYFELSSILDNIEFDVFYKNNVSNKKYTLNYGKRKGQRVYSCIKDTASQFDYDTDERYIVNINQQFDIIDAISPEEIDSTKAVLLCIEIFDWGRVQNSNIIQALDRHRKDELTTHLHSCKRWFEDDSTLNFEIKNAVWTSGWTKVYSFMFDKTTIYDSRVSAFINYILVQFYFTIKNDKKREAIQNLCSKLVTFKGVKDRARKVGKADSDLLGIKRLDTKKVDKVMIANKVSSWLLRYLASIEYGSDTQENFRSIDKAAFLLGFDISQIDRDTKFT